jgi:hypothetical protein
LDDGRSFKVVEAVRVDEGRWEFLAVAPLVGTAGDEAPEAGALGAALVVEQLALPYALPA